MKSIIFIILSQVLFSSVVIAQRDPKSIDYFNEIFRLINNNPSKLTEKLGGDYYLDEWKQGVIYPKYHNTPISNYHLRYFVYNQEFHVITPKKDTVLLGKTFPIDSISIDGKRFVFLPYVSSNSIREGYFQELVNGKIKLLKRYSCIYVQGNQKTASGYEKIVPDHYKIKSKFYYQTNTQPAKTLLTKKRDLLQLFNSKAIDNYIKQNNLKLKKEDHLIKIFEHYNHL